VTSSASATGNGRKVFKILGQAEWDAAQDAGVFAGSPVDHADGYIHFSTADQVAETAALHFKGRDDLVLLAVDCAALGSAIVWEPSRGGSLFPHLYAPMPLSAVEWCESMPLGLDGRHKVPDRCRDTKLQGDV
jgi:uncharacterized protein (DUF952 family)